MGAIFLLVVHSFTALVRMLRAGGARAIVAGNLLLKQQLLVIFRNRQRAPNLRPSNRLVLGLLLRLLGPRRTARAAILVRPSTLLKFHQVVVRSKYRDLFAPRIRTKPGPKGPSARVSSLCDVRHGLRLAMPTLSALTDR